MKDGYDAVQAEMQNTENAPIEEVELYYPVMIKRYELIPDSGGAGKFRGGLGVRRDFWFPFVPTSFSILSDGRKYAPWGLLGGLPGRVAHYILDPEGEARELPSKITVKIPKGGVLSVQTPGGGGYGPPQERDPEAIKKDLRDGKVTEGAVHANYGSVPIAKKGN